METDSDERNPQAVAEPAGGNVRQIELCIFLAGLSCFAQLYLFQPVMPVLTGEFGITPAESSFAVSFSTLGMAVGLFSGIFFADRIPRKKLISAALILSSLLTVISSFASHFWLLIALNTLKGILLAGSASVVVTYIAEEVHPSVLGRVTSMNIAGNAVGGMSGRIVTILITGWLSWQWAAFIVGLFCLLCGLLFAKAAPESVHFKPVRVNAGAKLKEMKKHLKTKVLFSMFILAAILLGCFVSVYNYLGFRLQEPPFNLNHTLIASIYLMYIIGSAGSLAGGILSDKFGAKPVLVLMIALNIAGILLLLPSRLVCVTAGLGLLTFAFFGAHAVASSVVARYFPGERSTSISLYLLFYYIGSSVFGTLSGIVMHRSGWSVFVIVLAVIMLMAFALVSRVRKKNAGNDVPVLPG